MKVFFSWSGDQSRSLAQFLAGWVSSVLQEVEPYISTQDIDKGERWLANITSNLSEIEFGVLVVTPTNKESPWLLFEAGALSKNLEKSRVIPILCAVTDADLVGSPLSQFQYARLEKDEVRNVLLSVNRSLDRQLPDKQLDDTFELWWPKLDAFIETLDLSEQKSKQSSAKTEKGDSEEERLRKVEEAVNELLHVTRRIAYESDRRLIQERERAHVDRGWLQGALSRSDYERMLGLVGDFEKSRGKSAKDQTLGEILGSALDKAQSDDD